MSTPRDDWLSDIWPGLVLGAAAQLLLVSGAIAIPLLIGQAAGEPYRNWRDFAQGPFTFAGAIGFLVAIGYLVVQVGSCIGAETAGVHLRLAEARRLRRVPVYLALGLSCIAFAMLFARVQLHDESLEILAGPSDRRTGQFFLSAGAVVCVIMAPAALALRPALSRRAKRLAEMCVSSCIRCAYDLTGITGPCPECGAKHPSDPQELPVD